jgi:drug/metabolite transporter (DMT)-like permease
VYHTIIKSRETESAVILQKQIGLVVAVIGAVLIIIASNLDLPTNDNDKIRKWILIMTGIIFIIGGCIFFALSLNKTKQLKS